MEGATPQRGGLIARHCARRLTLAGAAPAAQKGGSLPPPSPVSCGAPGEAGTRGAQPRYACRRGRGKSVPTRVQYGFPGRDLHHSGEGAPSESGALWGQKNAPPTCATRCLSVAHGYDGTALTPGGGICRSILIRPRPPWRSTADPSLRFRRPCGDQRSFPTRTATGAAPLALRAPFAPPEVPFLPLDVV